MMELPTLTLIFASNDLATMPEPKAKKQAHMSLIEKKVVLNSGLLINSADNRNTSIRKVADCLADAVGLNVDFSSLAA